MAFDKTLILERWDTPCADLGYDLIFEGLAENETGLTFSVRHEGEVYDFRFEAFGPYQVADEAFLQAYQLDSTDDSQTRKVAATSAVGNTCIVTNSDWEKSFNLDLMYGIFFESPLTHYHISTADSCLDILAGVPPTISVRTNE